MDSLHNAYRCGEFGVVMCVGSRVFLIVGYSDAMIDKIQTTLDAAKQANLDLIAAKAALIESLTRIRAEVDAALTELQQ